ncbi:HotDog domain-containing protein [Blastocladiella britannica]|nr:HotDog domain-containing protein [Blastocladiella britannica]
MPTSNPPKAIFEIPAAPAFVVSPPAAPTDRAIVQPVPVSGPPIPTANTPGALTPGPSVEESLYLEELDTNLFRVHPSALWRPYGSRGVFGGQIIGLALVAATHSVPRAFKVHSLHSYFLLGGDNARPILFHVTPMRDSRSFVTRQVTAQQAGKIIFVMLCSFHTRAEASPLEHQYRMPVTTPPELLPTREAVLEGWLSITPPRFHESIKARLAEPIPVDIRPVDPLKPIDYLYPARKDPTALVWMKAKSKLPVDPAFHLCVAAYCSDHQLVWTTVKPHGLSSVTNPALNMIVSLDHSMWFHTDFKADEWLLYEMESPRVNEARGVALGRLWTRDGTLAVTCAQEGLLRATLNPDKPITAGLGKMPPKTTTTDGEKDKSKNRAGVDPGMPGKL